MPSLPCRVRHTRCHSHGREEVKTRCPGRRAGLATDIDFSWASSLPRARGVKARWIPAPCQVPGRLRAGMKGGAPSPRRSGEVDGVVDGYAVLYSAFAIGLVGDYDHTFIDEGLLPGVLAVAIRISPVLPVISVVFRKRLWNGGDGQNQCYCRRWRCCRSGRGLLGCCGTSWGRSGCPWACGVRFCRLGCGCPGSPGRWFCRSGSGRLGRLRSLGGGRICRSESGGFRILNHLWLSGGSWRCRILISIGLPRAFRSRPYRRRSSLC